MFSLLQDGGALTNNPAAIALHECRLLWPGEAIHCVVSMGNGRYEPAGERLKPSTVGIKSKINKIVQSATDTEGEGALRVSVWVSGARECEGVG